MQFLYPQMFLWLFIPTVVLFYFMVTGRSKTMKIFSDEVYEKLMLADRTSMGRTTRIVLIFLALFMMIIAFARPVIDEGEKEIKAKGTEILIGLDISRSMDAGDIYPSRLQAAKEKVLTLLEQIRGDKVAILAYAADSYLVAPMTRDMGIAAYLLESMDTRMFGNRGSNMEALLEASSMFEAAEGSDRAVLLLSDGDEGSLETIIEAARKKRMRIYAIGMAGEKATPIADGKSGYLNDSGGNIVLSKLNPELKTLALETGGAYTDHTTSPDDILALYGQIAADHEKGEFESEKIRDYTELFYYPLGMAALLLLIAFHSLPRMAVAVIALSMMAGYPQKAAAASFDFDKMEEAQAAYAAGEYDKAIRAYDAISGLDHDSDAARLHNMGNAYFRKGDYESALKRYQESLVLDPGNPQTTANMELTKKRIQQQKQQGEQQSAEDSQDNQKSQKQDGRQQQQQAQESSQEQNNTPSEDSSQNRESSPSADESKEGQEQPGKESAEPGSQEPPVDREEAYYMQQLDQKPNPIPLKRFPVKQGEHSDKNW